MDYGISDNYMDEEDDDDIPCNSRTCGYDSEEEPLSISELMKAQKERRQSIQGGDDDGIDDFEKEMAKELDNVMKNLTNGMQSKPDQDQGVSGEPEFYDDAYFDSDDSDPEGENGVEENIIKKNAKKHKVLTNDELFYDPEMDDEDEAWVEDQRRNARTGSRVKTEGKGANAFKVEPLPHSDAVLSCPACFTTLCLDCQRHEIYKNQYRAMFVFNCHVDKAELLHIGIKEDKKFKKKKKSKPEDESEAGKDTQSLENDPNSTFHPVKCSECNTKVGVQDLTELYHFFNVLSSY